MSIKQNGGVFGRNPTFNDVTIEGQLTFEGNIDIDSDITWEDGKKALFGDSGDLAIYHHNNNSYIKDTGQGDLIIEGSDNIWLMKAGGSQVFLNTVDDGAVTLYHSGNPKIATTSGGCDITGSLSADGAILSGNLELSYAYPRIKLTDTDHNSDYSIINNNGEFGIFDDTNNAYRINVSASGDVSIPSGDLTVSGGNIDVAGTNVTSGCRVQFTNAAASKVYQVGAGQSGVSNNGFVIRNVTDSTFPLIIDDNSNVSIPNGELYINGSSLPTGSTAGFGFTSDQFYTSTTSTGANTQVRFYNGNGLVGNITTDGSATAFNTSSDYRLKEDVQPMSGATDRLKELKPVNFAWKADGSRVDGFLAHEAQEVVPESVTGSKDAMQTEEYEVSPATGDIYTPEVVAVEGVEAVEYVAPQDEVLDEEGNVVTEAVAEVMAVEAVEAVEGVAEVIHSANVEQPSELEDGQLWRETTAQVMGEREVPDYQGIDQAKLVPLLVATIQELEARITALES